MTLTAKQEAFCQAIADGLNQSDAYRKAYDASGMKAETVNKRASELMASGEVAGRVDELREALAEKAVWSRLDSIQALREIAYGGESRPTEKVAAIKELNAMHGYNAPAKLELSGSVAHGILKVPPKNG